jgi:hypothetical protein
MVLSPCSETGQKRRERREHAENCRLEQSLILGGSAVQAEYDSDFARLGRRFGIGDGKTSKDLAPSIQ